MKTLLKLLAIAIILIMVSSCTKNQRARTWGGHETLILDPGCTFVNVTWKDENLWVLTLDPDGDYRFQEYSSFGMLQGSYTIRESKALYHE